MLTRKESGIKSLIDLLHIFIYIYLIPNIYICVISARRHKIIFHLNTTYIYIPHLLEKSIIIIDNNYFEKLHNAKIPHKKYRVIYKYLIKKMRDKVIDRGTKSSTPSYNKTAKRRWIIDNRLLK